MSSIVYWLHLPEHTNIMTQGYVGVTKDVRQRFMCHRYRTENVHLKRAIKKYGWENIVKTTVLIAEKVYCLMVEAKLRAFSKIGWNEACGGGAPPANIPWNKGRRLSAEELEAMRRKGFGSRKGCRPWNFGIKLSDEQKKNLFDLGGFMRGKPAYNKGKPMLPHVLEALRQSRLGRPHSDEWKAYMSRLQTGRVFEKITCPHCQTVGGLTAMKRWHFEHCNGARKLFKARTTINGKRLCLGSFATQADANMCIEQYRKEHANG